ncbi:hypothetical protein EDC94DRAFT_603429 [Helicostylum pulchrum]|uniref:Uncharacterized protein n=1 Tax=Helicostylum pulchrum TaxID=562976 RepID=A0ABP9YHD2_9FUNG|nr:hypothetical protein EDC94DRAFT_603429 [Helicostylum pulchrum]
MNSIITLPATCELCGNWLPGHTASCARNGVHPSQWCLGIDELINQQEDINIRDAFVNNDESSLFDISMNRDEKEEPQIKKPSY